VARSLLVFQNVAAFYKLEWLAEAVRWLRLDHPPAVGQLASAGSAS
jgi:hypothetical protein